MAVFPGVYCKLYSHGAAAPFIAQFASAEVLNEVGKADSMFWTSPECHFSTWNTAPTVPAVSTKAISLPSSESTGDPFNAPEAEDALYSNIALGAVPVQNWEPPAAVT